MHCLLLIANQKVKGTWAWSGLWQRAPCRPWRGMQLHEGLRDAVFLSRLQSRTLHSQHSLNVLSDRVLFDLISQGTLCPLLFGVMCLAIMRQIQQLTVMEGYFVLSEVVELS